MGLFRRKKETEEERIKKEEYYNHFNNNNDNDNIEEEKEPIIEEDKPQEEEPEEIIIEETGTVYEKYMNMSNEEKASFYLSFDNPDDFFTWLNNAEAEYIALHPTIVVGEDDVIDFGSE